MVICIGVGLSHSALSELSLRCLLIHSWLDLGSRMLGISNYQILFSQIRFSSYGSMAMASIGKLPRSCPSSTGVYPAFHPFLLNSFRLVQLYQLLISDSKPFLYRFSETHSFAKPNDIRALQLVDRAARALMEEYPDIVLGFGESDEYSFLFKKSCSLYKRRQR